MDEIKAQDVATGSAATEVQEEVAAGLSSSSSDDDESRAVSVLSNDELLQRHYPRYFYDKAEKDFPVDLNQYAVDRSMVPGCNGVATPSKKTSKRTWLIYMTYYTQDGGVPTLGGTGGHKHDLEIVIVEIGRGQRVKGVFYGPHSSHEHMWIRNRDDLDQILDDNGRPRVYVSNGKHAGYPVSGRVVRLFGFGSDVCSKPTARDRPLFLLNDKTKNLALIDDEFAGPKKRITRDWSKAPETRISEVRSRRAIPPIEQITKELSKLAFWK